MKRGLLFLFIFSSLMLAQSVGDFGSAGTGNWGNTNTNWKMWDGSGWNDTPSGVPTANDNVYIRSSHTVTLDASGKNCKNLIVQSSGKLYNNSSSIRYLNIFGDITCDGTIGNGSTFDGISFNIEGSSCAAGGSGTIDASVIRKAATTNLTSTLSISIDVNLRMGGTAFYNNVGSTFDLSINSGATLSVLGDGTTAGSVSIDGSSGSGSNAAGGTITVNGTLTISGSYGTLGSLILTNNNTGRSCNLLIGSTGIVNVPSLSIAASGTAGSYLLISNGGLLNFTNSGFGSFTSTNFTYTFSSGSTVQYSADGDQTIGNPASYSNLTLSGSGSKTLSDATDVNSILNLEGGNLVTTNTNLLTLGSSAIISGGSSSSFIDGPIANTWSTTTATKTYPLGKGSTYRPLDITLTSPSSPVLRAEVFNSDAGGSKGSMTAISTTRYYQTSLLSGTSASGGNVKITFGADDGVTDNSTLVVCQCATISGTYSSLGRNTSDASSVTSTSYNPADGDFLLLGDTGSNPLPVQLISFSAFTNDKIVKLSWRTATELNNYGFEVERSGKAIGSSDKWVKIGFVQGSGNSNSPKNYSYTDEPFGGKEFKYRLKQIDFDGAYEYSDEVTAVFDDVTVFELEQNYPNPFNPSTKISYTIPKRSNIKLRVYNMLAQLEAELVDESQEAGHYQVIFNGSNLPSGTYFYKLEAGKFVEVKKFILVK